MAITVSNLQRTLRYKTPPEKERDIERFVATLDPRERKFYEEIYLEIEIALTKTRHVEKAKHLTIRQGVFMPDLNNFGLYYQIGCVIQGKPPITPGDLVKKLNQDNPLKKRKSIRGPAILDRTSSPQFQAGKNYIREDDQ